MVRGYNEKIPPHRNRGGGIAVAVLDGSAAVGVHDLGDGLNEAVEVGLARHQPVQPGDQQLLVHDMFGDLIALDPVHVLRHRPQTLAVHDVAPAAVEAAETFSLEGGGDLREPARRPIPERPTGASSPQ